MPKTQVGMSWIKDISLTAREFGAQEALTQGFVSGVFDNKKAALDRGLELAKEIATKSPVAVQGTKAVINYSRDHSVSDGKSEHCERKRGFTNTLFRARLHSRLERQHASDKGCLRRIDVRPSKTHTDI